MLRIVVTAIAVAAAPATAQGWRTGPVTMVVTFAAGTAGDVVGRILSGPLGEALGRTVIVDNVPGGGGITGSNRVAKAAPDGYQFLVGTVGTHAIAPTLYKSPPYNAVADFAPVGLLLEQPIVLLARKDLPGRHAAGVRGLYEGPSKHHAIRLRRHRDGQSSRLRASQHGAGRQRRACPLPQHVGHAGPGIRTHRLHVQLPVHVDGADRKQADHGDGRPDTAASAGRA